MIRGANLEISTRNLIKSDFEGNYKLFANAINLNSTAVYRALTGRLNPGRKFIVNWLVKYFVL